MLWIAFGSEEALKDLLKLMLVLIDAERLKIKYVPNNKLFLN